MREVVGSAGEAVGREEAGALRAGGVAVEALRGDGDGRGRAGREAGVLVEEEAGVAGGAEVRRGSEAGRALGAAGEAESGREVAVEAGGAVDEAERRAGEEQPADAPRAGARRGARAVEAARIARRARVVRGAAPEALRTLRDAARPGQEGPRRAAQAPGLEST